jgi:hypothetical protein
VLRAEFADHAIALGRTGHGPMPLNPPWIPCGGSSLSATTTAATVECELAVDVEMARIERCRYATAVLHARRTIAALSTSPPSYS